MKPTMANVGALADSQAPSAAQSMMDTGIQPLTAYRTARAMSVNDLAAATGIEFRRIADFESGRGGLAAADFETLGRVLSVGPDILSKG